MKKINLGANFAIFVLFFGVATLEALPFRARLANASMSTVAYIDKLAWTFTHRELPNAMDIQWQTSQSWVFQPPWFPIGFGVVRPRPRSAQNSARAMND